MIYLILNLINYIYVQNIQIHNVCGCMVGRCPPGLESNTPGSSSDIYSTIYEKFCSAISDEQVHVLYSDMYMENILAMIQHLMPDIDRRVHEHIAYNIDDIISVMPMVIDKIQNPTDIQDFLLCMIYLCTKNPSTDNVIKIIETHGSILCNNLDILMHKIFSNALEISKGTYNSNSNLPLLIDEITKTLVTLVDYIINKEAVDKSESWRLAMVRYISSSTVKIINHNLSFVRMKLNYHQQDNKYTIGLVPKIEIWESCLEDCTKYRRENLPANADHRAYEMLCLMTAEKLALRQDILPGLFADQKRAILLRAATVQIVQRALKQSSTEL